MVLFFFFFPDVLCYIFFNSTISFYPTSLYGGTQPQQNIVTGYKLTEKEICTPLIHFVNGTSFEKQKRYYYRFSFVKKCGRDLQCFWRLFLKRVLQVHAYVSNFFSPSVSLLSMAGCVTNSVFNSISMFFPKQFLLQLIDALLLKYH